MNIVLRILLIGLLTVFFSCGASQKMKEPNAQLDQMMAQKAFQMKIRTAEPQVTQALSQVVNSGLLAPGNTVGRIDVTGSGYFIRVQGDSVTADLPYYGERQMGGGYNSETGIKFDGIPSNLEIIKNEEKQSYQVKFSIRSNNTETYLVNASVAVNNASTVYIQSSHRNRIRYSGNLTEVEQQSN